MPSIKWPKISRTSAAPTFGEVVSAKNTLEATLKALPDAVVLLDGAGHVQTMNPAAVTVLASAGVYEPCTLDDLRLEGLEVAAVARAIAAGGDVVASTDLARTIRVERDGAVQRLLPRVVPVSGLNAQQPGAILLLYDVTDLVRLDEMRSELVAVASHELQTPLTTLRMTLLMLQEASDELPARQRELLATSLFGVEQLAEIVHEFLDLTRIEAGELRLNLEPVALSSVLAEAVHRIEAPARGLGVLLRIRIDPSLPQISADRVRMRAVFDNILSNALKYTPEGGIITIQGRRQPPQNPEQGEMIAISIIDTGPGIPPSFRSRIFDKFFRLEHHQEDRRPCPRGAGIGLYMCRQIIQLHGGEISCDAGSHERGTCITVRLPAMPMAEMPAKAYAQHG